jgi:hypothetical protein
MDSKFQNVEGNVKFDITNKLKPLIVDKDTRYKVAIHVNVRVACIIYNSLMAQTC